MSIWKDKKVKIIHAYIETTKTYQHRATHYGLGDDNKLYRWSHEYGAWRKHWIQTNQPLTEEGSD